MKNLKNKSPSSFGCRMPRKDNMKDLVIRISQAQLADMDFSTLNLRGLYDRSYFYVISIDDYILATI